MVSAKTASQNYFKKEFAEGQEKYLSRSASEDVNRMVSGKLAARFGLEGQVTKEQFERLIEGQDPRNGKQLINHVQGKEYERKDGTKVKPDEHKIGTDMVMSPPKSVTAVALVGGEKRALDAHRRAVTRTLAEIEHFTQANRGNGKRETTGTNLVVSFEHDSDRPVQGFIAPQLHTHNLILNMTVDRKGQFRSVDGFELFKNQHYFTTFYRAVLAGELKKEGFEIEQGENGKFEIKGVSPNLIEAYSPRAAQRDAYLEEHNGGRYSARAAELAILHTRGKKVEADPQELRRIWNEMDIAHGGTVAQVIREAEARRAQGIGMTTHPDEEEIREHVRFAVEHLGEREAVFDETRLLAETMKQDIGGVSPEAAKRAVLDMMKSGELVHVAHRRKTPQAALTTPDTLRKERENIAHMVEGKDKFKAFGSAKHVDRAIARNEKRSGIEFNPGQKRTVAEVIESTERVMGINGLAGVGKTTALRTIAEIARGGGYTVHGFAPSAEAGKELAKAIGHGTTLQSLTNGKGIPEGRRKLYIVDEGSLASTVEIHKLFEKVGEHDRVLLVGDTAQHLAVEAGHPFKLLQDRGMATSRLDQVVRQQNPELLDVVRSLAAGKVKSALKKLDGLTYKREDGTEREGIVEIKDRTERLRAMVDDFVERPDKTLAVAPDNHTRKDLNEMIHAKLQGMGHVGQEDHRLTILVQQDTTAAQRKKAATYQPGTILRTTNENRLFERGEYLTVLERNRGTNRVTVERSDGERVVYNPKYLSGVQLYRTEERNFAEGDRIQFTMNDKQRGLTNRGQATVIRIDETGLTAQLDGKDGDEVRIDRGERLHIEHGYAVTSHSSQGKTIQNVLVHAESDQSVTLINTRLAYVATSRATHEARWYTDNKQELTEAIQKSVGKTNAVEQQDMVGPKACLSASTLKQPNQQPAEEIRPDVNREQERSAAIRPAARVDHVAEIEIPKPSIEQWSEVRSALIARANTPDAAHRIDEQHREGRLYADDQGRGVALTHAGRLRILDGTNTKDQDIGPARASAAMENAARRLEAERGRNHETAVFVGTAVNRPGGSYLSLAGNDGPKPHYAAVETSKIMDPDGIIRGTNREKSQRDLLEAKSRAVVIARDLAGTNKPEFAGTDLRTAALTLALSERGYQAFAQADRDTGAVVLKVFDKRQVGETEKAPIKAVSRVLETDQGLRVVPGAILNPARTRAMDGPREQVPEQRQQRVQPQQPQQSRGFGISR